MDYSSNRQERVCEARSSVLSLAAGVLHQVELKEERGRARDSDCDSVKTNLNTLEEKKIPKVTTAYKYVLCPLTGFFTLTRLHCGT